MSDKTKLAMFEEIKKIIAKSRPGETTILHEDAENCLIIARERVSSPRGDHDRYHSSTHWTIPVMVYNDRNNTERNPLLTEGGVVRDASVLDLSLVYTKIWADVAVLADPSTSADLGTSANTPRTGVSAIDSAHLENLVLVQTTALRDLYQNWPHNEIMSLDGSPGLGKLVEQSVSILRSHGIDDDGGWDCDVTEDIPVAGKNPAPEL